MATRSPVRPAVASSAGRAGGPPARANPAGAASRANPAGAAARSARAHPAGRGSGPAPTTVGATALVDDLASDTVAAEAAGPRARGPATTLRAVPAARATTGRPTGPLRSVRAVRSNRWKRRIRTLFAGTLLVGVVLIAFAAVAMHAQLASRQLRLNVLRTDVDAAEREHQRLRLTVAELDTPEQVVSSAYSLGLVGAAEVEFLPTASTMQPPTQTAGPTVPDLTTGP